MNKKHIVAAALALSLSLSSSNAQAAEASVDLGVHIQQVIAEIHAGDTDWNKMIGRIDRLVAHIDQQVLDGTGDYDELTVSRERLLRAKAKIQEQYLTGHNVGDSAIAPIASAPCEICGAIHGAPVGGPAPVGFDSGIAGVGSISGGGGGGGGGFAGGGGGGIGGGGFGGLGVLGGIGAAIAFAIDDDNDSPGIIASPSTP